MVRRLEDPAEIGVEVVTEDSWARFEPAVLRIEKEQFSGPLLPLQETPASLHAMLLHQKAIFLVAVSEATGEAVGYACGAALEAFADVPGVKQDLHFGTGDTFYIASWAVTKDLEGRGIGRKLLRALILRARQAQFQFQSAHVQQGRARARSGIVQRKIPNYYGTGLDYEYYRRDIRLPEWSEGCRVMLNVQTILAGFSVILLALIAPRAGQGGLLAPVSLGLVVVALLFLAYSAERSSDALDRRDPWQYTGALSFYNFGVLFLLAGLAAFLTQVGLDSLHASGGLSVGSVAVFVAAAILGGFGVYVWGWDSFWLLKPANRVAHTFVMESGEID